MTTPAIDAVLFDLDGTLVEYERTSGELLQVAFERTGVEQFFEVDEYFARYAEHVEDSDDMVDLRERCFAAIAADRGRDPEVGREVARTYAAERDHGAVYSLPGAEAAVEALADEYRVGLVTNGAPGMQRTKMEAVGLDGVFETEVFAGHDAAAKPSPEPFHLALADLDVAPEQSVYVGNSLRSDVAGARAAGCRSVWVPDGDAHPDPDPEPHHALSSLAELTPPPWR